MIAATNFQVLMQPHWHQFNPPFQDQSLSKMEKDQENFQEKVNHHLKCELSKSSFHLTVNSIKPDVVIGTDSWLKKSDTDASVFPTTDYEILRRDRKTYSHGGVFLMTKKDLLATRENKPWDWLWADLV